MTVMIFRGGLGRLEEQISRWPLADRPSPMGPPCLCLADSLPPGKPLRDLAKDVFELSSDLCDQCLQGAALP